MLMLSIVITDTDESYCRSDGTKVNGMECNG